MHNTVSMKIDSKSPEGRSSLLASSWQRLGLRLLAIALAWAAVEPQARAFDLNNDGQTDLYDFAMLQSEFTGGACNVRYSVADLNLDGCVDLVDYVMLMELEEAGDPFCVIDDTCQVLSPADCRYSEIESAMMGGTCGDLADPIDRRLCTLGILLDGNTADAVAQGATVMIDRVADVGGVSPGATGDSEQPRSEGDPNGFNIAESIMLFSEDSDPTDGIDDSFLYIAWDVSDNDDGTIPGQFDSDDDSSACTVGADLIGLVFDLFPEFYGVQIQSCTTSAIFDDLEGILDEPNPNGIFNAFGTDAVILIENAQPLETESDPAGIVPRTFPTADGLTNPTNACIDSEVNQCGSGNDVEMIISAVETSGYFGPSSMARADSEGARMNRFALAQTLASLNAGSSGDFGDEEFANVAYKKPLPGLEASKGVRCADTTDEFSDNVSVSNNTQVEYELTITNSGNTNLAVTIQDTIEAMGDFDCGPVCGSLEAFLTSPRRGLDNSPVNDGNALSLGLEPEFFTDDCNEQTGFLARVAAGESALLGDLLGAKVERGDQGVCEFVDGDTIVVRFRANAGNGDTCEMSAQADCRNLLSVTGTTPEEPSVIIAEDIAEVIDTDAELQAGADDNTTTVDVICRELTLTKEVRLEDRMYTVELSIPYLGDAGGVIEYRHTIENRGEIEEEYVLSDIQLCQDIAQTDGANAIFAECLICEPPEVGVPGQIASTLASGAMESFTCKVQFDNHLALVDFLSRDDDQTECQDEVGGYACYRNCADVQATADPILCGEAEPIVADAMADICTALFCGDGIVDPDNNETCDDGNDIDDDECRNNCTYCGDGNVDPGTDETCDDGNDVDDDDCRNDCTYCGDGMVDEGAGETCDDGNDVDDDDCRNDCTYCGDGMVDEGAGETCDDGNDIDDDDCRNDCTYCGDGMVDEGAGETCDDGNDVDDDDCRNDCTYCGDGMVDEGAGETCDDGNDIDDDDCRNDCTSCGDGNVDPGETCDDGNDVDDDDCRNDCTSCGDGNVDPGETCDDGNDVDDDDCRNDCTYCGDGMVDEGAGETCDDGNDIDDDDCRNDCTSCGDGNVDPGETCDDGNDVDDDDCRNDCTYCGDGMVDEGAGETCDDGNDIDDDDCRNDCTYCGDGMVDEGAVETCDDGNDVDDDDCRNDCTYCGDGMVDEGAGETCDDGNDVDDDDCRNDCTSCGDGMVDPGETCDDGNDIDDDDCRNDCTYCGDGMVDEGAGETCDDGNDVDDDDCRNDCTYCGDGMVDEGAGETCDDGNDIDDDDCRNDCTYCGDGMVDEGTGETCDDGNDVDDDDCRNDCTFCGDGNVDPGETCDDGNDVDDDDCRNDCTYCGDGMVDEGAGETCDDGNDVDDDDCRNDCTYCGDGIIQPGEECDDGNDTDGDGCSSTCEEECTCEVDNKSPKIECPPNITCICPESLVLDFETDGVESLPAGFIFDGPFPGLGVTVTTDNANPDHPDLAVIFDTGNKTGGDTDLATPGWHPTNTVPLGKVIVIAENATDGNGDGLIDDPDDEGGNPAGYINFDFDNTYIAVDVTLIDIEEEGGSIKYFLDNVEVGDMAIPAVGCNSVQTLSFNASPFDRLKVNFAGSGAIGEISLTKDCPCEPGEPIVYDECDENPTVTFEDVPSDECPLIVTRTWTATDFCGNTATCLQTITYGECDDCDCPDCDPQCPEPGTDRYRLHNHPDGNAAPPFYGLRLDELFNVSDGDDIFSFDFDHQHSEMWMDVTANTIRIFGMAYGGLTDGDVYGDPAYVGVWEIAFLYDIGVGPAPGDDDTVVDAPNQVNSGFIRPTFNANGPIALTDYRGSNSFSFRVGDEDDDSGHRGFPGTSGWGWLIHGPGDHVGASDWLFVAKSSDECINECDPNETGDTEPPVIDCPPSGTPTVTDNCDPNPGLELMKEEVEGECPQQTVRTKRWVATDECGNKSTCVQIEIEGECPLCGNGIVDDGESCDDGNDNNDDDCRNDCTFCGDGIVNGDEECDEGDENCKPSSTCPPVELVFVMDTSGSMQDEGEALCESIGDVVSQLSGEGVDVFPTILAIAPIYSGDVFSCQNASDSVSTLLGNDVPGNNGACSDDLTGPGDSNRDENWGSASAIVADRFDWSPGSVRIIVPISDEGACMGSSTNGCNDPGSDRDAVDNAIAIAVANNVLISPITGTGSDSCVTTLAQAIAAGTGGIWHASSDPDADLASSIASLVLDGCSKQQCTCTNECRVPEVCGNGVVDPGESCDDGNDNNDDGCRNNCTRCGDGIVDPGEDCDDGNDADDDSCPNNCICEQGTTDQSLILWNFDECDPAGPPGSEDPETLAPQVLNLGGCAHVSATPTYNDILDFSCQDGLNNTLAVCFPAAYSSSFLEDHAKSVRFRVTIEPNAGQSGSLSSLSFLLNSGLGDFGSVKQYGLRVLIGDNELFRQTNLPVPGEWEEQVFDFSSIAAFTVDSSTTFKFELLGYDSNGGAIDIENMVVTGGCGGGCIVCGNGVVDPGEDCDDGNTDDGDDCPSDCRIDEPPPDCGAGGYGWLDVNDDDVYWRVFNLGEVPLNIESIHIDWPSGNHELQRIKFDGNWIYENPESPPSAWIDSGWTAASRVLNVGDDAVFRFDFKDYASHNDGLYEITINFEEGCSAIFHNYMCDKPMEELTMIWDGAAPVRIKAWKGAVGSTLLDDIDNIAPGDEISVDGYTGSPNNVYWELFQAGTSEKIGESRFHVSCSDSDMNGPLDCGKRQGDGSDDNQSYINDWILEGIVDEGGELDCTP